MGSPVNQRSSLLIMTDRHILVVYIIITILLATGVI